jgi:hypothetical protein
LAKALDAHLAWCPRGMPWEWKLCETTFMLPRLATIIPGGRFIHLIRDGRDVAFSDHVAPEQTFWRRVYFQTDAIRSWRGMRLEHAAYERRSHLFNARHWQESVRLGRAFGAMLGPAYREVRYEQVCADPVAGGPGAGHCSGGWVSASTRTRSPRLPGRSSATRSANTEPRRARSSLRFRR